ncbi:hypothetical protein CEXT_306141 [Caerostris extrusa]|uniref:Uncharacterized protein n=1 Tax=Caerostris extrusa TaxID=172846 RepID=A0AAV4W527_CAEEX|nr:hypothetical protein CEXT_306141 [Caerostris extrusa]
MVSCYSILEIMEQSGVHLRMPPSAPPPPRGTTRSMHITRGGGAKRQLAKVVMSEESGRRRNNWPEVVQLDNIVTTRPSQWAEMQTSPQQTTFVDFQTLLFSRNS